MKDKEIKILTLETGLRWPFFGKNENKKALSASSLTKILREVEYGEVPEHILLSAANRGKLFHETIQGLLEKKLDIKQVEEIYKQCENKRLKKQIKETVIFIKNNNLIFNLKNLIGCEMLRHEFYKNELLASYIDIEFEEHTIEMKTNSVMTKKRPLILLTFKIQLLIQFLCTKKKTFLLWSTGEGIIFEKFQIEEKLVDILDELIENINNYPNYSLEEKKNIVERILNDYNLQKTLT